jgi:Zn-dependent protease with chaperone function
LGRRWFFVIAVYFVLFSVFLWLVELPLAFYSGYVREHAYGISNQTLGKWFGDAGKELLITLIAGPLVLWLPYLLLRHAPRLWWLVSGALALPLLVVMILVTPLWIAPLFNDFGPMKDKALEQEILRLADRAGIDGSRVFEVNKSVDTKSLNAYVTGFLDTKRIVLWDTLIARLNREEVLFVMGHEMGHYVLGHLWQLLIVYSLVILLTLYAVHRTADPILARYHERFGFRELHDIASLPLLLLFLQAITFLLDPPLNAFSRHLERECDRFGIEITRNHVAAATAFVKLQQENLGNPRPGWVYRIWRASHPPLGDRIDFCNAYHPWTDGHPLKFETRFRMKDAAP